MTFHDYYSRDISIRPHEDVVVLIGADNNDGFSLECLEYCSLSSKYRYNKLIYANENFFILSKQQEFNLKHPCTVSGIANVLYNGKNGEKTYYLYKGTKNISRVSLKDMFSYDNEVYTINGNVIVTMEDE